MKTIIKILIVEDDLMMLTGYRQAFKINSDIGIEVLAAFSTEKAKELYEQNHSDLSIIVMDADLGTGNIETIPLIEKFRETFKGPIIANSSLKPYNDKMMAAGCDYCSVTKNTCPEKVFEIIAQFQKPI